MLNGYTHVPLDGPSLVFGGPYSNLQATRAVLAEARKRGIAASHMICTGDLVAYCGSPAETIDLVRTAGIHVVMGNCDEQLAQSAGDCGCGFPAGGSCERLSAAWFAYADSKVGAGDRAWLATLPRRIDAVIGGRTLAVIHGSIGRINEFVFASTPAGIKRREIEQSGCDGVIGGHCGVPFTQVADGKLWHNPGVIGMPANDGTGRTWYSVLTPQKGGLQIEHCALSYDHSEAARAMQQAELPGDYCVALASGIWPSCDVLPARERLAQGQRLDPGTVVWKPAKLAALRNTKPGATVVKVQPRDIVLWPTLAPDSGGFVMLAPATACCDAPVNALATRDLYRDAALTPDATLCCTGNPVWQLPDLHVPRKMIAMNYGCGSTVHPADLARSPNVLYVGVGGGLEILQFAYFSRRRGAVIGLDVVDEMIEACDANLGDAEEQNAWFKRSFVDLRKGDATSLPIADETIDVAAQNCLFNIFHDDDLKRALSEMNRVLRPGGRLILSDPICETAMPDTLRRDERLRAMCLTGAIQLQAYIQRLGNAGFGTIEVRARRPYRVLGPGQFATDRPILLESVEICAIKSPVADAGPTVFAGETAIYFGSGPAFHDGADISLPGNQPVPISMAAASRLRALARTDIYVSDPTWSHSGGGGCC